jgi:ABC-type sugar transport system ATPase subunit
LLKAVNLVCHISKEPTERTVIEADKPSQLPVIFSGPFGVGKSTLISILSEKYNQRFGLLMEVSSNGDTVARSSNEADQEKEVSGNIQSLLSENYTMKAIENGTIFDWIKKVCVEIVEYYLR